MLRWVCSQKSKDLVTINSVDMTLDLCLCQKLVVSIRNIAIVERLWNEQKNCAECNSLNYKPERFHLYLLPCWELPAFWVLWLGSESGNTLWPILAPRFSTWRKNSEEFLSACSLPEKLVPEFRKKRRLNPDWNKHSQLSYLDVKRLVYSNDCGMQGGGVAGHFVGQ